MLAAPSGSAEPIDKDINMDNANKKNEKKTDIQAAQELLNKETIRTLSEIEAAEVNGGMTITITIVAEL
jgi:hypothetical protein